MSEDGKLPERPDLRGAAKKQFKEARAKELQALASKLAAEGMVPAAPLKKPRGKSETKLYGLSKKDVRQIVADVQRFLSTGDEGMDELETRLMEMAVTAVFIEGRFGTELWRTAGAGIAGMNFAAGNRTRFIEGAYRLLQDLRASRESRRRIGPGILEGVLDAQTVDTPTVKPAGLPPREAPALVARREAAAAMEKKDEPEG